MSTGLTIISQNIVVPETYGHARVCARLTGTIITLLPLSITFTPRILTMQGKPPGSSSEWIKFNTLTLFLSPLSPLDDDFNQTLQTVTLHSGDNKVCVNIGIIQDNIQESNESFCVDLSSNDSAVQFQPNTCQSMVTILDESSKSLISVIIII